MKLIHNKPVKGKIQVTYELEPGETLVSIQDGAHYRLADSLDDVIASHYLEGMQRVVWCSIQQEWIS